MTTILRHTARTLHKTSRPTTWNSPRRDAETFWAKTETRPETYWSETETRPRRWALCPRRDRDVVRSRERQIRVWDRDHIPGYYASYYSHTCKMEYFWLYDNVHWGRHEFLNIHFHTEHVVLSSYVQLKNEILKYKSKTMGFGYKM